ncbi:MAG: TIGR02996 domain-containing protein [Gemmataceae bacterium]|nr:TIGR02996 domain-containing protein [Gemmataceae bacterium]
MKELDLLLTAIMAAPQDDLPRLLYADWLQENGQVERAWFVRVQLQLARHRPDHPEWPTWEQQQRQLLERYEQQWTQPLRTALGLPPGVWGGWVFRRGCAEYFHLPAALLLQRGAALRRVTPLLALYLYPCSPAELRQLVRQEWFGSIIELYAPHTVLDQAAVVHLVDSPYTRKLQRLEVAGLEASVDTYWQHACEQRFGITLPRSLPALPPADRSRRLF